MVKVQHDYSMCTVATRITLSYGKIKEARIVVGALTDKPTRLEEAEKLLVGQKPSDELFVEVAKKAAAKVAYRKDYRASKEYQKELCEIMIRRSLIESAKKAGK
jgi:CO/xanthine dehydrogenase FAD-binding subunit